MSIQIINYENIDDIKRAFLNTNNIQEIRDLFLQVFENCTYRKRNMVSAFTQDALSRLDDNEEHRKRRFDLWEKFSEDYNGLKNSIEEKYNIVVDEDYTYMFLILMLYFYSP
tara:strand:- start:260 stop:595 length:336 start_codon:yes stop_codon:yes gene_type:complete